MRKYLWLIILIGIVLTIWIVNMILHTPVRTQLAESIVCEDKIDTTGILVRDETVYLTGIDGEMVSDVNEEQRVASGEKIATVYASDIDISIREELSSINEEISALERAMQRSRTMGDDVMMSDMQIRSTVGEIISMAERGNYSGIRLIKEELSFLINNRSEDYNGEVSQRQVRLDELKSRKEQLEKSISASKNDIYASLGGVYSSLIDGYEDVLTTSAIESMTIGTYKYTLAGIPNTASQSNRLASGDVVCKIVDNSQWMLAATISEREAYGMTPGLNVQLRVNSLASTTFQGRVVRVSEPENGEVLVVVSANRYIATIYSARKVEFSIIRGTYRGIGVPTSAMRSVGGEQGVFISSNGVARFRPAKEIFKKDGVSVVISDKLKLYDNVIVNGKDIEEGKIL